MLHTHADRVRVVLAVVLLGTFLPGLARGQARDITLESTQRLLSGVFTPSGDSMQILAALRSTHDPALIPLFERLGRNATPEMQLYAMVSKVLVSKDSARLDVAKLLATDNQQLVGSALATLIDGNLVTNDQLKQIMNDAADAVQRVMAASELARRKALPDREVLRGFLVNNKDEVRYYAAITVLQDKNTADHAKALEALKAMGLRHDPRDTPIATLMMIRVRNEKILAAAPWVESIAVDEKNDESFRQSALSVLLALGQGGGPRLLAQMIAAQMALADADTLQQMRVGLITFEFARQLQPGQIAPLAGSKTAVVRMIAKLAADAADGRDTTPGLVKLLKEGHPLILDWALMYADRADADQARAIRLTLLGMSTIADEVRGRDYERAVLAAQKIIDEKTPGARKALEPMLHSENPAVIEAVLAGLLRSGLTDLSDLVVPVWPALNKSAALESATNYAALILAREGRPEALGWLPGMVQGGTVQSIGFRALAGWYYAQLQKQTEPLVKQVLAQAK